MKELVDLFEALFSNASERDGDMRTGAARFAFAKDDRSVEAGRREPARHIVVQRPLEATCQHEAMRAPNSPSLGLAPLPVTDQLRRRVEPETLENDDQNRAFSRNYTALVATGTGDIVLPDALVAAFSLHASDTECAPRALGAEESHWISSCGGEWKVDADPWFAIEPDEHVRHKPHGSCNADQHPTAAIGPALDQSFRLKGRDEQWRTQPQIQLHRRHLEDERK